MCNPSPGNKQTVNIVVASNGEGGGTERQRLQGRMDGSIAGSGPQPPQPPQPPPPTGEGCSGADYSVRTEPGNTVKAKQQFTIRFQSRGPMLRKDWISVYKLPNAADRYYYEANVNHPNIKSCGWTLSLWEVGQYGIAYFKDQQLVATTYITVTE
jgi:hypothetical protein